MELSAELLSQFTEVTNDKVRNTKKESFVYGTTVVHDGRTYVKLDGSELLTPISTTTNTQPGERVTVMIKNHTATITGNISSPSARLRDITDQSDAITELEILIADKVDTSVFIAETGRIDNLVVENASIKQQLTANEIIVRDVQAENIEIEKQLTAANASIDQLETNKLDASVAVITYATISDLQSTNADIHNLEVTYGNFVTLTTQELEAIKADIEDLDANVITVDYLKGKYATITELDVERGRISNLEADVGDVNTLIFGSATGDVIQTSFANAVIAQLGNAQIKSAMIESLSASKITAGDIITNNVRVMSEDGKLLISDETIQISDTARVRVQIGKDAAGDYSINIWDADGKLMLSEGGITDSAIKEAIIRNDMVSDTANIAAHKLDIDSLFEEINGSTKTIKSSKIFFDDEGQTLDVAFTTMTTDIDELQNGVASQGTQISVIQGQIESKVWQQDIDSSTDEMSTKYSLLEQTVDTIDVIVASHTTDLASVSDQVSELEVGLNGFKTNVSETYVTKNQFNNLAIGGRNLIRDSKLDADTEMWNFDYNHHSLSFDKGYAEISRAYDSDYTNRTFNNQYSSTNPLLMPDEITGKTYVLQVELKAIEGIAPSKQSSIFWRVYYDNSGDYEEITLNIPEDLSETEWRRCYAVHTFGDKNWTDSQLTIALANLDNGICVRNIMLERATKPSAWSPAPEDIETRVTRAETQIIQNADSITALASRTSENEDAVASLELTADRLTSRVITTETNIKNLEIGGRNLFENSAELSTGAVERYFSPTIPPYTVTMEEDSEAPSGNCAVCAIGEITTAITNGGFYLTESFGKYISKMIEGETYTVSVWVKCSRDIAYGAITAEFLTNAEVINKPNLSTKWQRYIIRGIYNGNTTSSVAITFYYNSLIQSNDVFYFSSPKVEKGNRATDWTVAIEDLARTKDTEFAQATAEGAQEAATRVQSLLQQLSDSISMLVTDGNGTSLMTQTENGWTFSTADIQSSIASAAEILDTLNSELVDTNNTVNVLQQAVDDLGEIAEYVSIGAYEGEPCIELGECDSEFKLRITNTRILFMEGSSVIAHFTNQSLHIKKAVIEEELQQGGFVWKVRSNGNMGLVWKGVNS